MIMLILNLMWGALTIQLCRTLLQLIRQKDKLIEENESLRDRLDKALYPKRGIL